MSEIKCPNCWSTFVIDESEYQKIVSQIRNTEFDQSLQERINSEKQRSDANTRQKLSELEIQKNNEISNLNRKIAQLEEQLKNKDENLNSRFELEKGNLARNYTEKVAELNSEIATLKGQIKAKDTEKDLAVQNATSQKNQKISELEIKISESEKNSLERAQIQKDNYENLLKQKDDQIEYYKNFKAKLSTKMVGESLEAHCASEFGKIRMAAFPSAYFEKDNDASSGAKGDFIFRDSADGVEFISIMFEMKNEADTTATKHKNVDFFAKLDKDRREKGCEYAVLVSLLESDNDLYNAGIVDVSYAYEKMYVVRPQFFVPIITLLRNAARGSLEYKKQVAQYQNQNLDITKFEANINDFKEKFGRNYRLASENFNKAIEEIDKTISHLSKVKDGLLRSIDNLRLANDKADNLTIKRLTKGAPSVKKMFDELGDGE